MKIITVEDMKKQRRLLTVMRILLVLAVSASLGLWLRDYRASIFPIFFCLWFEDVIERAGTQKEKE